MLMIYLKFVYSYRMFSINCVLLIVNVLLAVREHKSHVSIGLTCTFVEII